MSRIVLKLGGRVAAEAAAEALALRGAGHDVVVVHGAGPQITAEMERRGIVPTFVNGRRFTTAEILGVVRGSLAAVNAEVCAAIGPGRAPLFGDEIGLRATHVEELGLVGHPIPSAPAAVEQALAAGRSPSSRRSPRAWARSARSTSTPTRPPPPSRSGSPPSGSSSSATSPGY